MMLPKLLQLFHYREAFNALPQTNFTELEARQRQLQFPSATIKMQHFFVGVKRGCV